MIRLVVTDLDGTVVQADGTISERVRRAFAACQAAGMHFCVATGRVRLAVAQLGQDYTICQGGTLVLQGEQVLLRNAIPAEQARAAWRWAAERGVDAVFFGESAWAATHRDENVAALARFLDCAPDPEPGWDVPLARLRAPVAELAAAFPGLHLELEGGWTYLRRAPGDKGTGLQALMTRLGLTPAEVICFGDELNDLPMFGVAGHAVAVANARPELKAVATRLAPPVAEDGVAAVLEELLTAAR